MARGHAAGKTPGKATIRQKTDSALCLDEHIFFASVFLQSFPVLVGVRRQYSVRAVDQKWIPGNNIVPPPANEIRPTKIATSAAPII
jgi:hypothetical protein